MDLLITIIHIKNWVDILIVIIPITIIIIASGFIFKWYEKDSARLLRNNNGIGSENKIKQFITESSEQETFLKHVKEIIKQIILQRSLFSRIKIEVESFEDMFQKKHVFYDTDFLILQKRLEDVDFHIHNLNQYIEKNLSDIDENSVMLIKENLNILISVNTLGNDIIKTIRRLDYSKYLQLKNQLNDHNQSLIKLYQTLTSHIQELIY